MTPEEIELLQKTNADLVARIGQLESINVDLVSQKKDLKKKLEEGYSDEDVRKELDNYKSQVANIETEKAELQADYDGKLNKLTMKNVLRDLDIEGQTPEALETIAGLMLDGATPKDGSFLYLNEDGTTKFNDNQTEYSITDRINELKESGNSYHFKEATGGGGGKTPATPKDEKPSINDIVNRGLSYAPIKD